LVFLHLSDIHFSNLSSKRYDPDLDLRRELVADAFRMRNAIGHCNGILVSGDIAFAGKADQYGTARDWLNAVCNTLGCKEEQVWAIPGNHDADRDVIDKSTTIQDKHEKLRQDPERELLRLHRDEEAFHAIHRPLAAYSIFAGGYGCAPKPGELFWEDDVKLNDSSVLRIRGCNSAIASDSKDDENANRLVVGKEQFTAPNIEGVTYLLMCHHPHEWLHDRDNLRDCLKARVRVCLFGHKHVQRVERVENTLIVVAGALHPERNEGRWQPRYNYISLSVVQDEGRKLEVKIWPRVWDDVNKIFIAEPNPGGGIFRVDRLSLPDLPEGIVFPEASELQGDASITDRGRIVNAKRRMVFRFHGLPYTRKLEIVLRLNLAAEEDQVLQEEERYPLYFKRAAERGILAELWTAIEQQHGVDIGEQNPFSK